jgi:hypothetical protein
MDPKSKETVPREEPEQRFVPTFCRFYAKRFAGRHGKLAVALLGNSDETIGIAFDVYLALSLVQALRQKQVEPNGQTHSLEPLPKITTGLRANKFEVEGQEPVQLFLGDAEGGVEFTMSEAFAAEFALGLELTAGEICEEIIFAESSIQL